MSRRYHIFLLICAAFLSAVLSFVFTKRVDPKDNFPIARVAVSRSGQWIAVASDTGWIGIFDHEHPENPQRFRLVDGGTVKDLRFTPDEDWLMIQDHELRRHPVKILGSTEAVPKGQDTSEPQVVAALPVGIDKGEITSNIVRGPGSGTVLFGNFAGSVEIHDPAGKLLERYTFR